MDGISSTLAVGYRSFPVLGRAVTADEAREVTGMVRRLAAVVLLGSALDKNYQQVRKAAVEWKGKKAED